MRRTLLTHLVTWVALLFTRTCCEITLPIIAAVRTSQSDQSSLLYSSSRPDEQISTDLAPPLVDFALSNDLLCVLSDRSLVIYKFDPSNEFGPLYDPSRFIPGVSRPSAVDIDPISNYVYWIDGEEGKLEVVKVISAQEIHRRVIKTLFNTSDNLKPIYKQLVVDHVNAVIYVVASHGGKYILYCCKFDGSDWQKIVEDDEKFVLAVDSDNNTVYAYKNGQIQKNFADPERKNVLFLFNVAKKPEIDSLQVESGRFYLNIEDEVIQLDMEGKRTGVESFPEAVKRFRIQKKHNVQSLNSSCHNLKCSHFCFRGSSEKSTARGSSEKSTASCACRDGFALLNSSTCDSSVRNRILFTANNHLMQYSLDVSPTNEVEIFSINDRNAPELIIGTVNHDRRSGAIFCSVKWARKGNADSPEVSSDVYKITELSAGNFDQEKIGTWRGGFIGRADIDWISSYLYFTDDSNHVAVMELYGASAGSTKLLLSVRDLHQPANQPSLRAIALDPLVGYLFISDARNPNGMYRANLDGSGLRKLTLVKDVGWLNGFFIDRSAQMIYLVDGHEGQIMQCDYNGQHQKVIFHSKMLNNPYDLVKFGHRIFVTNFYKSIINFYDDATMKSGTEIDVHSKQIWAIDLVTENYPIGSNLCDGDTTCSHFCFLTRKNEEELTKQCACPDTLILSRENPTQCIPKNELFIYMNPSAAYFMSPESLRTSEKLPCDFTGLSLKGPMAYDVRERFFFFIAYRESANNQSIYRCDLNESGFDADVQPKPIIGGVSSSSLAYDWSSRLLFWSDLDSPMIFMADYEGRYKTVLVIDVRSVSDLTFKHPYLYYFATSDNSRERMLYQVTVSSGKDFNIRGFDVLQNKKSECGLSVDLSDENTLHWVAETTSGKFLQKLDFSAGNEIANTKQPPLDIASDLVSIFWERDRIFHFSSSSLNIYRSLDDSPEVLHLETDNMEVISVIPSVNEFQHDTDSCYLGVNQCEQLCFSTDRSQTGSICSCDQSSHLAEDKTSCVDDGMDLMALIGTDIYQIKSHDVTQHPLPNISFRNHARIEKFDYDSIDDVFYLIVDETKENEKPVKKILARDAKTGSEKEIPTKGSNPKALAVDPVAKNLVWIGQGDSSLDSKVFIYSLYLSKIITVIQFEEERLEDLALLYADRYIYVTSITNRVRGGSHVKAIPYSGIPDRMDRIDVNRPSVISAEQTARKLLFLDQAVSGTVILWRNKSYDPTKSSDNSGGKLHETEKAMKTGGQEGIIDDWNSPIIGAQFSDKNQMYFYSNGLKIFQYSGIEDSRALLRIKWSQDGCSDLRLNYPIKDEWKGLINDMLKKSCSHFYDFETGLCYCPVNFTLSDDGKSCQPVTNAHICPLGQKYITCVELCASHESLTCMKNCSIMFCEPILGVSCTVDQTSCTPDGEKSYCLSSSTPCALRPSFCPCAIMGGSRGGGGRQRDSNPYPVLFSIIGCIGLVLVIAQVIGCLVFWKKHNQRRTPEGAVYVTSTSLNGTGYGNEVKILDRPNNLKLHSPPICIDTSTPRTPSRSSKLKNVNINPTPSHFGVQDQGGLPHRTSCMSSSCSTINYLHGPPPTPVNYTSDNNMYQQFCDNCRQHNPRHSKSSWASKHNFNDIQSGEESDNLFLPKPRGADLPSGARYADHHHTLPAGGYKYMKKRTKYVYQEVTYAKPLHHHHHSSHHHRGQQPSSSRHMPPPPAPNTPMSGSQENTFHPPSPSSERTSVHISRSVRHYAPPPSPVSNA